MKMPVVSISDARKHLAGIIGRVSESPVYLSRHGKNVAAVVDADELSRLLVVDKEVKKLRATDQPGVELHAMREADLTPAELIARRASLPPIDVSAFRADVDAVLDASL